MPRVARAIATGVPHHVTLRGNDRQKVFFQPEDYQFFLSLLDTYLTEFNVEILGFSLMTNHAHEVLIPHEEDSLAKALGPVHSRYARYINLGFGRKGHLWEERFYSSPLDVPHLWSALCYVERNPVRAGLVERAWDYPWSSAGAHVTGRDSTGLLSMKLWKSAFTPTEWRQVLEQDEDVNFRRRLMQATLRGRPCGSDSFVREIEVKLARKLHPSSSASQRKKTPLPNE